MVVLGYNLYEQRCPNIPTKNVVITINTHTQSYSRTLLFPLIRVQ